MRDFLRPEAVNTNRQELPAFYRLNGAIYLADVAFLQETQSFMTSETYASVMPAERSVDIDTLLDFRMAEFMLRARNDQAPRQETLKS